MFTYLTALTRNQVSQIFKPLVLLRNKKSWNHVTGQKVAWVSLFKPKYFIFYSARSLCVTI